jgi:hypothetical protein
MAQSQLSAPSLGEAGGAGHWDSTGTVDEQPIDVWSRLPGAHTSETPAAATEGPLGTSIGQVLSAWRAAERQLDALVEASPMRFVVLSDIARLRAEYQRLVAQAMR